MHSTGKRKDGLTCTIKASVKLQPGEQCFAVLYQLLSEADTHETL